MTALKYWDTASSSYKVLTGPPGPTGAASTVPGPTGPTGPTGPAGADSTVPGPTGATGQGVPTGGSTAQVLAKVNNANFNTSWQGPMLALAGGTLTGLLTGTTATFTGLITPSATVGIKGTATNDLAQAGSVGEVISSNVASPGVTLTTNTAASVTSISLTAGDWDVAGEVVIVGGTAGPTLIQAAINPGASIPIPGLGVSRALLTMTFPASQAQILVLRPARVSLASTTTYNLVGYATFASGTTTAYGNIIARRAR